MGKGVQSRSFVIGGVPLYFEFDILYLIIAHK